MKITRKCARCGKNYESTDRKNASIYCGKICKDEASQDNLFKNDNVSIGLEQVVEISDVERLRAENEELKRRLEDKFESNELIGMIVTPQKVKADEMWSAVRLLHNQKQNLEQLTKQADEGMKLAEKELSDCNHKMFLLNMTDSELLELAKLEREILSRRSGFKNLLTLYGMLEHLSFEPEVTQAIKYGKTYSLKTEQGKFSFGDVLGDFKVAQSLLIEEENRKLEEKEILSIQNEEVRAFAEELNSVPIKGRMITTISFQKHSISDLKAKYTQLEPKCKAMRVDISKGTITTYN